MKLGTELKKEEERKEEPKKEEKNPKPERTFPSTENVYHFHPIAFVNHMKKILGREAGVCLGEARVRAFLRMLREGEGTVGEEGYTTLFGGGKFKDTSKHPETVNKGSSAAGAYQFMRYTWWELKGEILDSNYKKTGKYSETKDYVKKYNIPDFSPLSQDKLCIIYMKHYKPGLIDLVIEGKIEKAIRDKASAIWASLPHKGDNSRYDFQGAPQPATPMEKCIRHFNRYLIKELKSESDLHVEYGFLKEFDFDCCKRDSDIIKNRGSFNIESAVKMLNNNAQPKSIGKCAKYVRFALEGGKLNTTGHPGAAKDYDSFLTAKGFDILPINDLKNYNPRIGDIAVFEAFKGEKKVHVWGHVQMYNGMQWVSDFKQNSFWAGSDYRKAKPAYTILRWNEK